MCLFLHSGVTIILKNCSRSVYFFAVYEIVFCIFYSRDILHALVYNVDFTTAYDVMQKGFVCVFPDYTH